MFSGIPAAVEANTPSLNPADLLSRISYILQKQAVPCLLLLLSSSSSSS